MAKVRAKATAKVRANQWLSLGPEQWLMLGPGQWPRLGPGKVLLGGRGGGEGASGAAAPLGNFLPLLGNCIIKIHY